MTKRATAPAEPKRERQPDRYERVPLTVIHDNDWNPRRVVDDAKLAELRASIVEKGILEPMILRPHVIDGEFEIVAGTRRFRAAQETALTAAMCVIKDLTDEEALEVALIENTNRQDMHPLDEAEAYATLQRTDKRIYTTAAIARRTGQTESHVYRRLKLLELDDDLRTALAEDRLSLGHAERLLRLPLKLRTRAAHPENGVVWRRSPLLDYAEKWIPGRDDLRPLADLEHFIRQKSHFDPTSEDTKHFQPELIAEAEKRNVSVDELLGGAPDNDDREAGAEHHDVAWATQAMVLLSDDPMARMRLGAGEKDRIPLTPSKWKEVTSEKNRCEHTVRGVVVHGGPARVLDVCTKRSCAKHWPVAKKKPAEKTARPAEPKHDWKTENRKREEERQAWQAVLKRALPAFAQHVAKIKFSAALVREVLGAEDVASLTRQFTIGLRDKTAAQMLACSTVRTWTRADFLRTVKPFKFNLGTVEQQLKTEAKKAAAGKAKADAKTIHKLHGPLKGKKAKNGKGKAAA